MTRMSQALSRRPWALAASGLGALSFALHWPVLVGGKSYFLSDIYINFAPSRAVLRDRWLHFEIPQWTNGYHLGQPFLADPSTGSFYLPNLLLLLPFPWSMNFLLVLHQWIFGAGLIAMLRLFGLSTAACFFGGAAGMLSGYISSMFSSGHYLVSVAWIPWVMACTWRIITAVGEKTVRARWIKPAMGLGVFLAFQTMAGDPQATQLSGFAMLFLMGAGVLGAGPDRRRVLSGSCLLVAAALLLCGLLAGIQILPTLLMMPETFRRETLDLSMATQWSFSPLRLFELFSPAMYGDPYSAEYFGHFLQDFSSTIHPWPAVVYLGLPTLALALAAMAKLAVRETPRRINLLLAVSLVLVLFGLAMAVGRYGPCYEAFFNYFPGGRLFRYPYKYLLLSSIGVVSLAAVSFDDIVNGKPASMIGGSVLFLILVGLALHLEAPAIGAYLERLSDGAAQAGKVALNLRNDMVWGLAGLSAFVLSLLFMRRRASRVHTAWILLPLAVGLGDEARSGLYNYRSAPAGQLSDESRFSSIIRHDAANTTPKPLFIRIYRPTHMPITITEEAIQSSIENRFHMERDTLHPNFLMERGFEYVDGFSPVPSSRTSHLISTLHDRPQLFIDIISTGYLVMSSDSRPPAGWARPLAYLTELDTGLYRTLRSYPYARVVPSATAWPSERAALRRLTSPFFNPGEEVTLEIPSGAAPLPKGGAGDCAVNRRLPEEVRVTCKAPQGGYLVLADGWYLGWSAFLDGKKAPIYPADVALRGLWLPPGTHSVRFAYAAPGLRLGAMLSLLGLLLLAGGLLLLRGTRGSRSPLAG